MRQRLEAKVPKINTPFAMMPQCEPCDGCEFAIAAKSDAVYSGGLESETLNMPLRPTTEGDCVEPGSSADFDRAIKCHR